jgi:hypothetical protein
LFHIRILGVLHKKKLLSFAVYLYRTMATGPHCAEYATIVQCAERLTSGLSADPLKVSNKLLEVGMVPQRLVRTMQLPSKDDYDKATTLVSHVTGAVKNYPTNFHVFMEILAEFPWLTNLVKTVLEMYEINKSSNIKLVSSA